MVPVQPQLMAPNSYYHENILVIMRIYLVM